MRDDHGVHSHYLTMCFSLKGWENVCFELGSEQLRLKSPSPTGEHMYTYFELSFELREVCVGRGRWGGCGWSVLLGRLGSEWVDALRFVRWRIQIEIARLQNPPWRGGGGGGGGGMRA